MTNPVPKGIKLVSLQCVKNGVIYVSLYTVTAVRICVTRSRASPELRYPTPEETTSLSVEDQRQSSDRYGHHETNEPENA